MGFPRAWRFERVTPATLLAIGLCALGAMAAGQEQPPPQQPTFRTGVNLVRVDVSVTDRAGAAIGDLQPSDFEIEEDGVRQQAETVQFLRLDGQPTPGSNESVEIRSQEHARLEATRDDVRIFAIFFDEYHIEKAPSITLRMRDILADFVAKLGPTDLVAIMDPLTPLSALEFTRSRRELLDRVKTFEGRRNQFFPVRSVLEEAQLTRQNIGEIRAGVTLSALNALVTYLGGLREGRKSVLFVSEGPPLVPTGSGLRERLEEALQSANRSNVTINVFDPRPLGAGVFGGADSIAQMAFETGGRRIVNMNAPGKELARVIDDVSAYYLVGYTPTREFADGKFHRIEVRVARKGARVESRRGYWAPKAEEMTAAAPPPPEEPGLRESLKPLITPVSGQPVALWVGMSRGDAGRTRVTVSWDAADKPTVVGSPDKPRERPVQLNVEPRDAGGSVLAEQRVIGPSVGVTAESSLATFELEPGEVSLRLEAHDATGETVDRWAQPVTVPDLSSAPVTLSTPRLHRARSAFELKALRAAAAPIPLAARDFQRTDRVFVDVDCYRSGEGAPTLVAELLNNAGKVLATLPMPARSGDTSRLELPMANLAIGGYVLRVKAGADDQQAEQLVAFRVVP